MPEKTADRKQQQDAPEQTPKGGLGPLYVVVFVCGAVLMALEIAGSRVVAPFLGSSVFVWGALIGVIMLALSIGYYAGGRIVDRRPSFGLLMGLVAAAGAAILIIPGMSPPVLQWIAGAELGPRLEPLIATAILFVAPSVLLAMVSPFSVRLAARELSGVGNVAGRLYALSTAGSIAGTLLTAFFLIPAVGNRVLVYSLGATLVVLAGAAMVAYRASRGKAVFESPGSIAGMLLVAVAGGAWGWPAGPGIEITAEWQKKRGEENVLIEWVDSPYHLIAVTEQNYETPTGDKRRRRLLRFNDRIESSIYIDRMDPKTGEPLEFESAVDYTSLLHMGFILRPQAKSVLFVGGGGGVAPTEFTRSYGMDADVVEIDQSVVDVAVKYFYLRPGPNLRIHVLDGRRFVEKASRTWDVIVLDAYTSGGRIPFHLVTREFYEAVKSRLSPDGIVVANLISPVKGEKAELYHAVHKTLSASGFRNIYTFPKFMSDEEMRRRWNMDIPRDYRTFAINVILVATRDAERLTPEEIVRRAEALTVRVENPVKVKDFVRHATNVFPCDTDSKLYRDAPTFTDDYSPADMFYSD